MRLPSQSGLGDMRAVATRYGLDSSVARDPLGNRRRGDKRVPRPCGCDIGPAQNSPHSGGALMRWRTGQVAEHSLEPSPLRRFNASIHVNIEPGAFDRPREHRFGCFRAENLKSLE